MSNSVFHSKSELLDEPMSGAEDLLLTDEQKKIMSKCEQIMGRENNVGCFRSREFLSLLAQKVSDERELIKYVINTNLECQSSGFNPENKSVDYDPRYALYFRRSIPDPKKPKPEVFWTNEFGVVFGGLKKEIGLNSPQRIFSEIFVTTKGVLDNHQMDSKERAEINRIYGSPSSDGEIRISPRPFDITRDCLFVFKPQNEVKQRDEYIKKYGEKSKYEILQKFADWYNLSKEQKKEPQFW